MKGLDQYLLPYIIVQVVAVIFLMVASRNTRLARLFLAGLFLYAAAFNMQLSLRSPDTYLEYAWMALPFYRDFINGCFSHYNHIVVPMIAVGQLLIGIGMLLKGWWVKWACVGAIIFLLSISPLMVGSGFPFSIIVSIAAWMVLKRDKKEFIWQKAFHTSAAV